MNQLVLFYIQDTSYGSMKFFDLAKSLNEKKYRKKILPYILTEHKVVAKKSHANGIQYLYFNPIYSKIRKYRLFGRFGLAKLIKDLILFIFYRIELKNILKKIKPSWLILSSDTSYNQNIVLSNLGIKSLVIQYTMDASNVNEIVEYIKSHFNRRNFSFLDKLILKVFHKSINNYVRFADLYGPYQGDPIKFIVLKFLKLLPKGERKGMGNSDYLCINGDAYIEIFQSYGVSKSKLIVTGNPLDDESDYEKIDKDLAVKKVRNYLKLENKKIVLLFLQPINKFSYINSIRLILEELMIFSNKIHIVLKYHPKNNKKKYKNLEENFQCSFIGNNTGINNEELAISSEFIITFSSTTGFLAFRFKKPLISFNFGIEMPDFLKHTGGSIHCTSINQFRSVIDKLINDKNSLKNEAIQKGTLAAKRYMKLDGKCVNRIFDILKK